MSFPMTALAPSPTSELINKVYVPATDSAGLCVAPRCYAGQPFCNETLLHSLFAMWECRGLVFTPVCKRSSESSHMNSHCRMVDSGTLHLLSVGLQLQICQPPLCVWSSLHVVGFSLKSLCITTSSQSNALTLNHNVLSQHF